MLRPVFTSSEIRAIRGRLAEAGVTQHDLAEQLGMHPTKLNHILRGRRSPTPDFCALAMAALARLERAEQAAAEARRKALTS